MNHHTPRSRTPGKRNPAGSKWKGEVFHGGELTRENNERAQLREHRHEVAYDNDEVSDGYSNRHYPQAEMETI